MIRRYNAERVKEWKKRKKLAQTFDKGKTQV